MQISSAAEQIIQTLHAAGHQALLVGGCVRDMLLDRTPKDWDVATDAQPPELLQLFPGAEPVGAHFGVILYRGVEIATFRSDGPYTDGRHPASVQFKSSPSSDAARRDFTINGLFYDTRTQTVLDFVGGQSDLANKTIRAIGPPAQRFAEDHLRLLRAVRFASRLAFTIEKETAAAIRAQSAQIQTIAAERTRDELTRILTGPHPRCGIELLAELDLLPHLLPEVKALPPNAWTQTLQMLDDLRDPSLPLAWAVLLHATGNASPMNRLRYPSQTTETVADLIAQQPRFPEVRGMSQSTRIRFLRQPFFQDLLELHRLDRESKQAPLDNYEFCKAELARLTPEQLHPERLFTGADLIEMGIPPGPKLGALLRKIEDAQLEGEIQTQAQARDLVKAAADPPPGS